MAEYRREFTKVVYGYAYCEADSIEEAERIFNSGEADEEDNKSDHDWTSEIYKEGD